VAHARGPRQHIAPSHSTPSLGILEAPGHGHGLGSPFTHGLGWVQNFRKIMGWVWLGPHLYENNGLGWVWFGIETNLISVSVTVAVPKLA
jgi:hypothetical protein